MVELPLECPIELSMDPVPEVKTLAEFVTPEILGKLRRFALALNAYNHDQADDLVQETMLKLVFQYRSSKIKGNIMGLLMTTLNHTHISMNRVETAKKRGGETGGKMPLHLIDDSMIMESIYPPRSYPVLTIEEAQIYELAQAYLRTQSAINFETYKLVYIDGMSYLEASRQLGVDEGTVKSRLNRAKGVVETRAKQLLQVRAGLRSSH